MDTRKNNPFSLTAAENDYFNNSQEKIQVVNCKPEGAKCKDYLAQINNNFLQSSYHHQNNDYRRAIEALENAYEETITIQGVACSKCVDLFRSTIIESLTNYHAELKSMTTGLFRKKRFRNEYVLADNLLNKFLSLQNPQHETKIIKMQKINAENSGVFAQASSGI